MGPFMRENISCQQAMAFVPEVAEGSAAEVGDNKLH